MDAVSLLKDESDKTAKLVRKVGPDQLALPTPCAGFEVRALVNHLCLGCDFGARAATGEEAAPDYERDFVGDDVAAAYESWKDAMIEACSEPGLAERTVHLPGGMRVPGAVLTGLALLDTVVHRWDLARAIGADPAIDPEVATAIFEQVRPMIPDELRAATPEEATATVPFGPAVEVPDDASPVHKLVAFLGRTP